MSIKPRRHVGGMPNVNKDPVEMRKSENSYAKVIRRRVFRLRCIHSQQCASIQNLMLQHSITWLRVLQSFSHGVSRSEWSVYAISASASSCCWSALSSSALILITPAAGSGISSSYRRPAFISSCCIYPVEHLASWYSVICLPDRFLPQTKDILVLPMYFVMTPAILATLKILIWFDTSNMAVVAIVQRMTSLSPHVRYGQMSTSAYYWVTVLTVKHS